MEGSYDEFGYELRDGEMVGKIELLGDEVGCGVVVRDGDRDRVGLRVGDIEIEGGVEYKVTPPPHSQQATFAVLPKFSCSLPDLAQLLSIPYHAQLKNGPSASYQFKGDS